MALGIFSKHSFEAFQEMNESKEELIESFCALFDAPQESKPTIFEKNDFKELINKRRDLNNQVSYYEEWLTTIHPDRFRYIKSTDKEIQRKKIIFALYVFCAKYQLDEIEHRRQTLKSLRQNIDKCLSLKRSIDISLGHQVEDRNFPEADDYLEKENESSSKASAWCAFAVVRFIARKVWELACYMGRSTKQNLQEFNKAKSKPTVQWLSEINQRRLYWIWGGGLLNLIMAMLPTEFNHILDAKKTLNDHAVRMGYTSWILYYLRLSINLILLAKHTFSGPWMSKEEKIIPWFDRFKMYAGGDIKFSILNDLIWSNINLVTFFWLVGAGIRGYTGNLLTCFLLLFDTSMAVWNFREEQKRFTLEEEQYIKNIYDINEKITMVALANFSKEELDELKNIVAAQKAIFNDNQTELFNKIQDINEENSKSTIFTFNEVEFIRSLLENDESKKHISIKLEQIINTPYTSYMDNKDDDVYAYNLFEQVWQEPFRKELEHAKKTEEEKLKKCRRDWRFKKYKLINALAYTSSLIISFTILCSLFFPPLAVFPISSMIMGIAGAGISFTLTVAFFGINSGIGVAKIKGIRAEKDALVNELLENFKSTDDDGLKKQLYLDMRLTYAQSEYQQRLIKYQKIQLVHQIFCDTLIPALVFSSLVFLPTGIGVGVLAAGLMIMVLAKIIMKQFEPKEVELPEFDERSYKTFADDIKKANDDPAACKNVLQQDLEKMKKQIPKKQSQTKQNFFTEDQYRDEDPTNPSADPSPSG